MADLISRNIGDRNLQVADVAGGKGYLQSELRQRGFRNIISFDKRKKMARGRKNYRYEWFTHADTEKGFELVSMERWRDHALFRAGIDSMLRASDLVRIRTEEILDQNGMVLDEAKVKTKKTGAVIYFPLTEKTKTAIAKWLEVREWQSAEWLFYGRPWTTHITDVRYRQIAKDWFRAAGLDVRKYSTHSVRRTKATIMYDETNDIKAISELLGHSSVAMTERYIGMTRKKAVALAAKIDV